MSPAFSSTKQAFAFALLVLVLLLLPAILGKWGLPPAGQSYASIDWTDGPMPYIHQQIFEEKGDIDIAFIGSSRMLGGINTPYVQEKLSEKLGRPAVVRSICWLGSGFDSLYLNAKQLLEHRKVRMLVINDENNTYGPIGLMPYWFRFGDDAGMLKGMPLEQKAWFYFASVAGMPRNLLCLLRPNIPARLVTPEKLLWRLSITRKTPRSGWVHCPRRWDSSITGVIIHHSSLLHLATIRGLATHSFIRRPQGRSLNSRGRPHLAGNSIYSRNLQKWRRNMTQNSPLFSFQPWLMITKTH